jgi:hypothetical protein
MGLLAFGEGKIEIRVTVMISLPETREKAALYL